MKNFCEKSVGTTELHYSTKKQEHSFSILKSFFHPTLVRVFQKQNVSVFEGVLQHFLFNWCEEAGSAKIALQFSKCPNQVIKPWWIILN